MKDLIEALQIFAKYTEAYAPTFTSHDTLHVDVNPELVSEKEMKRLEELGFEIDEEFDCFYSFRFGSC